MSPSQEQAQRKYRFLRQGHSREALELQSVLEHLVTLDLLNGTGWSLSDYPCIPAVHLNNVQRRLDVIRRNAKAP